MPIVRLHHNGEVIEQEVKENSNLVVLAGIRKFPYPYLKYGCGMGKCTKCRARILRGGEHLQPPNWKEEKMLKEKLQEGYRLTCQLYITHDIEFIQE
ncbi:2Fe-2S iron-sulfur cluster-binding protein [Bacillaceae bacterium]